MHLKRKYTSVQGGEKYVYLGTGYKGVSVWVQRLEPYSWVYRVGINIHVPGCRAGINMLEQSIGIKIPRYRVGINIPGYRIGIGRRTGG